MFSILMSFCRRFLSVCPSIVKLNSLTLYSTLNVYKITDVFQKVYCSPKIHISTTKSLQNQVQEIEKTLLITNACIQQLKKIASSDEFLRVSVEGGGCSGFSYKFALDTEIQTDDICFDQEGVRVISDEASLDLIKGSTVDYEEELIKSAFCVKDNPQSSMKCSCGVSFGID